VGLTTDTEEEVAVMHKPRMLLESDVEDEPEWDLQGGVRQAMTMGLPRTVGLR
jgi:hypothetical protein